MVKLGVENFFFKIPRCRTIFIFSCKTSVFWRAGCSLWYLFCQFFVIFLNCTPHPMDRLQLLYKCQQPWTLTASAPLLWNEIMMKWWRWNEANIWSCFFTRRETYMVVVAKCNSGCYSDGKPPKCIFFSKPWWLPNDFEVTPITVKYSASLRKELLISWRKVELGR